MSRGGSWLLGLQLARRGLSMAAGCSARLLPQWMRGTAGPTARARGVAGAGGPSPGVGRRPWQLDAVRHMASDSGGAGHERHSAEAAQRRPLTNLLRRERIGTVPNMITAARLVLTPCIGYTIVQQNYDTALALLVVAGLSDWVDGTIARAFPSQQSLLGAILDPLADKALVLTVVASMGIAGALPPALSAVIIIKDTGMVLGSFWLRYASLKRLADGRPIPLSTYFDLGIPSARVRPLFIGKACTALQLFTLVTTLLHEAHLNIVSMAVLEPLWWATGITTAATAVSYAMSRSAVTFLDKSEVDLSAAFGIKDEASNNTPAAADNKQSTPKS